MNQAVHQIHLHGFWVCRVCQFLKTRPRGVDGCVTPCETRTRPEKERRAHPLPAFRSPASGSRAVCESRNMEHIRSFSV